MWVQLMQDLVSNLSPLEILFSLLVVTTLLGLFVGWLILREIRVRYRDAWIRLGEPSLFGNNSLRVSRRLRRFIRSGELKRLESKRLDMLNSMSRMLSWLQWSIFLAVAVAVALSILESNA